MFGWLLRRRIHLETRRREGTPFMFHKYVSRVEANKPKAAKRVRKKSSASGTSAGAGGAGADEDSSDQDDGLGEDGFVLFDAWVQYATYEVSAVRCGLPVRMVCPPARLLCHAVHVPAVFVVADPRTGASLPCYCSCVATPHHGARLLHVQGFKSAMNALSNATLCLVQRPKFGEEADMSSSDEDEELKYGLRKPDEGPDAESVSTDTVSSFERRRAFRRSHVIVKGTGPVKLPLGVALEATFDGEQFFSKANRNTRDRLAR